MRSSLLYVLSGVSLTLSVPIWAQTALQHRNELVAAAQRGDTRAILDLGKLRDRSVIPILEQLALQSDLKYPNAPEFARRALARLGNTNEFQRIAKKLQSDDPAEQDHAVEQLEYIGGKEVFRTLIGVLDESQWEPKLGKGYDPEGRGPNGERPLNKVFYGPLSYSAMLSLARIVPRPPVPPGNDPRQEHVRLWKKWWLEVGSKLPDR